MPSSKSTASRKTATSTKRKAATPRTATPASAAATAVASAPAAADPAPAPEPTVVEETKPVAAGPMLKKPELIDRVIAETGMKKKDVKPVVESMLNVLGLGLANGEEMNLPPLGKVMINRTKEMSNANVFVTKVRQPKARAPEKKDPLADAAD
jgi:DNA-binding protein HU-alpha